VENKHNTETSRNGYPITMFQGGPPHKPYFITINVIRQKWTDFGRVRVRTEIG